MDLELELISESADLIIFKSKAQRGHGKQDPTSEGGEAKIRTKSLHLGFTLHFIFTFSTFR